MAVFQTGALATLASGSDVADVVIAGRVYQIVKPGIGDATSAGIRLDKSSRSDTFVATGNGTTLDVSSQGFSKFSLQVKQTGTVTSWTVVLEGSLDNTNFEPILKHMLVNDGSADKAGNGRVAFTGANACPSLYFRARCVELTLGAGTNVVATIMGVP